MAEKDCVFCKIISGEIPSYKIGENDNYLALLDIARLTEGHTLVIPKVHFETIWDVTDIQGYFSFIQEVGNHFRDKGFKYVDSMTMGRMVPHAHFHVIPHTGDGSDWELAIEAIGNMQTDPNRRLSPEKGAELVEKYAMN